MKLSRKQLRRLIESTLNLNEAATSAQHAFLNRVISAIPQNTWVYETGLATLGTNEQGKKGVLVNGHRQSTLNPILIAAFKNVSPGKTVEYLPKITDPNPYGRGDHIYKITVQGTEPLPGAGPGVHYNYGAHADLIIAVNDPGRQIQGQASEMFDGDFGLFRSGPLYFIEM
jgi:hypothetical protein